MVQRICIVGLAKSGTSALYASVKAALPAPRRLLFEPNNAGEMRWVWDQSEANALTKIMFTAREACGYDPRRFTHNIGIVRDPRDVLVSSVLFQFNRMALIRQEALFDRLVDMFRQKETDPHAVSIASILDLAAPGGSAGFRDEFAQQVNDFADYLAAHGLHVLSYDQMIAGDLAATADYLGIDLAVPARLSGWTRKIDRKGESGDWKNWFTAEDVAFFRDSLGGFIARHGFDADWDLEPRPVILPAHSSDYVLNLAALRRADPNLKAATGVDDAALASAIEDGKYRAMIRRLELIGSDAGQRAERDALVRTLAGMGYWRYGLRLAVRQLGQGRAIAATGSLGRAIRDWRLREAAKRAKALCV